MSQGISFQFSVDSHATGFPLPKFVVTQTQLHVEMLIPPPPKATIVPVKLPHRGVHLKASTSAKPLHTHA